MLLHLWDDSGQAQAPAATPYDSGGQVQKLGKDKGNPTSWLQTGRGVEAKSQLLAAGFEQLLSKNDDWNLQLRGSYFFTPNMSGLVAFAVGEK
ncbi:hypothetical protein ZWY2020_037461 [Hordeum vulgare]|nr:hypothetical protein ZWY2020_037461 [Hordeum vulgare]